MKGTRVWLGMCVVFLLGVVPRAAGAHGSVVAEDDLCVINVGYLKAHFKIYLPQQTGHREYCEDIPVRGESVFVMEYQHDGLADAAVGFRIIRNVTGKGIFARLEDVKAIDDIDSVTLRFEEPAVVPDVFTLLQNFVDDGEYIGIVTADDASSGKSYSAVFPFEVGDTGIGVWPWIVAGLVILQGIFWFSGRSASRPAAVLLLATILLPCATIAGDDREWTSDKGKFTVSYLPSLQPVPINTMHSWMLLIMRADGTRVQIADVEFNGGMPDHNHGLPSAPRVVSLPEAGQFRVDGVRFHMHGYWAITIAIDDGEARDNVVIPLQL
jgi:hypothetical protein